MRMMAKLPLFCVLLLVGCAETPAPLPSTSYTCTVPGALLQPVQWPLPPTGSYTQRDVAVWLETQVKPAFDTLNGRLAAARQYFKQGN